MKLRIRGNSLRLRVSPSEAATVAAGHRVQESTCFGPGSGQTLHYSLEGCAKATEVSATLEATAIRVRIPLALARSWFESKTVGIEKSQQIDAARSLDLLIEKDFECLGNHAGPSSETYANPLQRTSVLTKTQ